MSTVTVSDIILAPDGSPYPQGSILRFVLMGVVATPDGIVVPANVDVPLAVDGSFTVQLTPNAGSDTGSFYRAYVLGTPGELPLRKLDAYTVRTGGPWALTDLKNDFHKHAVGDFVGLEQQIERLVREFVDGLDVDPQEVDDVLSAARLALTSELTDQTLFTGFIDDDLIRATLGSLRTRILSNLTTLPTKPAPTSADFLTLADAAAGLRGARTPVSGFLNGWLRPILDLVYAPKAVGDAATFAEPGVFGRLTGVGVAQRLTSGEVLQLLGLAPRVHLASPDPDRSFVQIDRSAGVIRFPQLVVQRFWREGVIVTPQTDAFWTELPYSDAPGQYRVFFADLATEPFQVRVSSDARFVPTADLIVLGWVEEGSWTSAFDFDVLDTAPPMPLDARRAGFGEVGLDALNMAAARLNSDGGRYGDTRIVVAGGVPIAIGDRLTRSGWQFTGAQGTADATWMPDNTEAQIVCGALGLVIEAGNGITFSGTGGTRATLASNAAVSLTAIANRRILQPMVGSVTYSNEAYAARDVSIATAGQSPVEYGLAYGFPAAFERALRDNDWMATRPAEQSINWIEAATGGSSLTQTANRWLDGTSDGPALIEFKAQVSAAVAAGQPVPKLVLWSQGEADAGFMANGTIQVASQKNALKTVWARIRAHMISLGAVDPCIICIDTGANDVRGNMSLTAIRWVLQQAIDEVAYAFYGAPAHDVSRAPGDIHDNRQGYATIAYRAARAYAQIVHGLPQALAPEPVSAALVSGNARQAVLTLPAGLYMPRGDVSETRARGPVPFGLSALPPNFTGAQAPRTLIGADILSSTQILVRSDASLAGARLATVSGWAETVVLARHPRTDDIHPGALGLPLRPWVSEPLA